MSRVWPLLLLVGLAGCHARLRRAVPELGPARTIVRTTQLPYVEMGRVTGTDLQSAVVNLQTDMVEWRIRALFQQAVDPQAVGWALEAGVAQALGQGPPMAWTGEPSAPSVLSLEVLEWGLSVPWASGPADFAYVVRARLLDGDGRIVYRAATRCEVRVEGTAWMPGWLGPRRNLDQLEEMRDGPLQAAFEDLAKSCGATVVARLRRHAGTPAPPDQG